jgi:hypothetical protein
MRARSSWVRTWLACLALAACSSGQLAGDGAAARGDDPDQEVANLERELTEAGPDSARIQGLLDAARDRAVAFHVDAGGRALRNHELAHAESELQLAVRHAPEDARVTQLRQSLANTRKRVAEAVQTGRARLQKLSGLEPRPEDRGEWLALLADLDELAPWTAEVPDAAHLRQEARDAATVWLLADARQHLAAGNVAEARAALDRAEGLTPGSPQVKAARAEIDGTADTTAVMRQADDLAAQGKHLEARRLYLTVLQRDATHAKARQGALETGKAAVNALLLQAKVAREAGRWPEAIQAANDAVAVGTEDPKLAADARKQAVELNGRLIGGLAQRFQTARARKLDAAALVYAREIVALVGPAAPTDSKQVQAIRKQLARLEAAVQAKASYRLAIVQPPVPKGAPAGVATALWQGVQARLVAAVGKTVALLPKSAKGADGSLTLTVPTFLVERATVVETRKKDYLDHSEVVDNPAYAEAQGRQSAALTALNAALDALRPVQDEINAGERDLHQSKLQLAEIEQKIAQEDAAYYKDRPSPCPGGKLDCAQTRGHERWKPNVAYYLKAISKSQAVLQDLEPERLKLQAAVDARQQGFDAAQKVAAETPRRVTREVWLPHEYVVWRHDLAVDATLTVAWSEPAPKGTQPTVVQSQSVVLQKRSDYSSDRVEVKGQVLEPLAVSALPTDPTVVVDVAGRLLDAAMPPVVQALAHHGERFARQAAMAQDDLTRVHFLMLAATSGAALTPLSRAQVLQQLADLTGWHADTGKVDTGRLQLPADKPKK